MSAHINSYARVCRYVHTYVTSDINAIMKKILQKQYQAMQVSVQVGNASVYIMHASTWAYRYSHANISEFSFCGKIPFCGYMSHKETDATIISGQSGEVPFLCQNIMVIHAQTLWLENQDFDLDNKPYILV